MGIAFGQAGLKSGVAHDRGRACFARERAKPSEPFPAWNVTV